MAPPVIAGFAIKYPGGRPLFLPFYYARTALACISQISALIFIDGSLARKEALSGKQNARRPIVFDQLAHSSGHDFPPPCGAGPRTTLMDF
jgi:hypothetical protein